MNLEVRELSKSYDDHVVLDNLNFSIPSANAIGIIGPSGSGKSTLLRILAGLEYPNHGTIVLDGETLLFNEEELRKYRLQIGVVFQSFNLFPHFTALENICLPLVKVHNKSEKEAKETALALLRKFEMERHANKYPGQLSGGQSQRVAIVRAIATKPKVLFLDEPTSALDPYMTVEVLDQILELKDEMGKLILVTHHLQFAKRVTDWIIFLEDGKIAEISETKRLFEHPSSHEVKRYLNTVLKY